MDIWNDMLPDDIKEQVEKAMPDATQVEKEEYGIHLLESEYFKG